MPKVPEPADGTAEVGARQLGRRACANDHHNAQSDSGSFQAADVLTTSGQRVGLGWDSVSQCPAEEAAVMQPGG